MTVITIIESLLQYPTIVTRSFLLIFVFGLLFLLIRGKNK